MGEHQDLIAELSQRAHSAQSALNDQLQDELRAHRERHDSSEQSMSEKMSHLLKEWGSTMMDGSNKVSQREIFNSWAQLVRDRKAAERMQLLEMRVKTAEEAESELTRVCNAEKAAAASGAERAAEALAEAADVSNLERKESEAWLGEAREWAKRHSDTQNIIDKYGRELSEMAAFKTQEAAEHACLQSRAIEARQAQMQHEEALLDEKTEYARQADDHKKKNRRLEKQTDTIRNELEEQVEKTRHELKRSEAEWEKKHKSQEKSLQQVYGEMEQRGLSAKQIQDQFQEELEEHMEVLANEQLIHEDAVNRHTEELYEENEHAKLLREHTRHFESRAEGLEAELDATQRKLERHEQELPATRGCCKRRKAAVEQPLPGKARASPLPTAPAPSDWAGVGAAGTDSRV